MVFVPAFPFFTVSTSRPIIEATSAKFRKRSGIVLEGMACLLLDFALNSVESLSCDPSGLSLFCKGDVAQNLDKPVCLPPRCVAFAFENVYAKNEFFDLGAAVVEF